MHSLLFFFFYSVSNLFVGLGRRDIYPPVGELVKEEEEEERCFGWMVGGIGSYGMLRGWESGY